MNREERKTLLYMRKNYKDSLKILKGISITKSWKQVGTTKEKIEEGIKIIEEELKKIESMIGK